MWGSVANSNCDQSISGQKLLLALVQRFFPGVEIGDRAVVGAGSLVLKDEKIPPKSVYVGACLPKTFEIVRNRKRSMILIMPAHDPFDT